MGRGDGAERTVRRRSVLHAVAGHRLLEHDAGTLRDRPDHRRVQLRHRPSRTRSAGRRRREPRRHRPVEQGRRLHRHPDTRRRLLRGRLRRTRDGTPVQRQPSVQRQPAQLLRRQPQRGNVGRGGQRLVRHGVRRHLPDRRPAGAQRPVLLGAEPSGDLDLHVVEPGRDQRGSDGFAAALRRRQRGAGGHVRPRLRADGNGPAAVPRDQRRTQRDVARWRAGDGQHRHDRDR